MSVQRFPRLNVQPRQDASQGIVPCAGSEEDSSLVDDTRVTLVVT